MRNGWKSARIGKQYYFSAAHHLPMTAASHPCHRMHGHNYVVEIEIRGDVEPQAGWIIDFHHIDQNMQPIIDRLDHQVLNDFIDNPTAENIALWIMDEMPVKYAFSVTVWETPKCWAKVINKEGYYTQVEKIE